MIAITRFLGPALLSIVLLGAAVSCEGGGEDGGGDLSDDLISFGARDNDGRYGLYAVGPDGSRLQKLSDEDGFIFFPRWSPTGDRIAYIVGSDDAATAGELRVYDFAAGRSSTVSDRALPSLDGPAVSWSPDGGRIAFTEGPDGSLRVLDVEPDEFVEVGDVFGREVDWSPKRDELVLISDARVGDEAGLYVVDPDGDGLRSLEGRRPAGNPRWSPDGDSVAFWAAQDGGTGQREVFVVNREGELLRSLGSGFAVSWSADGTTLAYSGPTSGGAPDQDIFVVAVDAGTAQSLSSNPTTLDSWPDWSPEGDRIAYVAQVDQRTALLCVVSLELSERDCLDLPRLTPGALDWR
jgi:TolB protein